VFTQVTVDIQSRDPVGHRADGVADRFGDRDTDGEPDIHVLLAQRPDMGEEPVAGSGRVRPQQDRGAVSVVVVGDLRESLVEGRDVVGRGVRPRAALPEHPGEGFAGVVQKAEQRVVAEGLLPRPGRGLFLRVADHDRRVHVQDQPGHRLAGHYGCR
jgi:hypothetical protein